MSTKRDIFMDHIKAASAVRPCWAEYVAPPTEGNEVEEPEHQAMIDDQGDTQIEDSNGVVTYPPDVACALARWILEANGATSVS